MKIGERKYGGATCEIRFAEGVPATMRHDVRMITNLRTAPESQRQGHATELLNRVFEEADKKRVILILNPMPFATGESCHHFTIGLDELVEWYGRLGFQEIQQEPVRLMARMFNIPQVQDSVEKVTSIILEGMK